MRQFILSKSYPLNKIDSDFETYTLNKQTPFVDFDYYGSEYCVY